MYCTRYIFNPDDLADYAKWDKFKYTRNLIHEGIIFDGKFDMYFLSRQSIIDKNCFNPVNV